MICERIIKWVVFFHFFFFSSNIFRNVYIPERIFYKIKFYDYVILHQQRVPKLEAVKMLDSLPMASQLTTVDVNAIFLLTYTY